MKILSYYPNRSLRVGFKKLKFLFKGEAASNIAHILKIMSVYAEKRIIRKIISKADLQKILIILTSIVLSSLNKKLHIFS